MSTLCYLLCLYLNLSDMHYCFFVTKADKMKTWDFVKNHKRQTRLKFDFSIIMPLNLYKSICYFDIITVP